MRFQFYLERLFASEDFDKFKKDNSDCFLCSGFFSLDKTGKEDNQQHLDFFVPSLDKMFSFKFLPQGKTELVPVEDYGKDFKVERVSDNLDFDFSEIEKMIETKMSEDKINKKIEKLLWSLQSRDEKDVLIGTVFISGLGLIKVVFDLQDKKIVDFEKKSFFDMVKVMKKNKS